MAAFVVLRNKAIKPLLAASQGATAFARRAQSQSVDVHYDAIRADMQGVFQELGVAA
jgi:hypothetical protein